MSDMGDVAGAITRIEELESKNDLMTLEYQKLQSDYQQQGKELKTSLQNDKL